MLLFPRSRKRHERVRRMGLSRLMYSQKLRPQREEVVVFLQAGKRKRTSKPFAICGSDAEAIPSSTNKSNPVWGCLFLGDPPKWLWFCCWFPGPPNDFRFPKIMGYRASDTSGIASYGGHFQYGPENFDLWSHLFEPGERCRRAAMQTLDPERPHHVLSD